MRPSALAWVLVLLVAASCAHPRATIDYTMSEGIIWPGPPEKPRIKYLWSLAEVAGSGGGIMGVLAGGGEESQNPRDSDFLLTPYGVFVDKRNILYVTDTGALRVNVVDLNSMDSFSIGTVGNLSLSAPIGVVAGPDGRIYVTDADLAIVAVYSGKGKFLSLFEGKFERPTGLAINSEEGLIYVADTWGHVIYVYGLDGKRLGSIGGRGDAPGQLNYPTHIYCGKDGLIYVSDTLNFRVQAFTKSGVLMASFGLIGDRYDSFDKIKGIAVDGEGHIYVADSAQDMVKIYDRQGRLLLFFGQSGGLQGSFSMPAGMYIDDKDRIFIADSLNGRVQVFQFLGGD